MKSEKEGRREREREIKKIGLKSGLIAFRTKRQEEEEKSTRYFNREIIIKCFY